MRDLYKSIFSGMSAEQIERLMMASDVYRFARSIPMPTLLAIFKEMPRR